MTTKRKVSVWTQQCSAPAHSALARDSTLIFVVWSGAREFGILRKGEVQGYILWLGNGTGGHHERCS
jgi:hypothetical protein